MHCNLPETFKCFELDTNTKVKKKEKKKNINMVK